MSKDLQTYTLKLEDAEGVWLFGINAILKVTYSEYIGLKLPLMLITVKASDEVLKAVEVGQEIKMTLKIQGFTYEYNMEIIDLRSVQDSSDKEGGTLHDLTISAIHKYKELVRTLEIKAYKGSIKKVLEDLGVKVGVGIGDQGDQVWIRANKSVKNILRKLVTHLYLGKKDCPISAITQEGIFVRSLQETMKKESIKIANYNIDDATYLQAKIKGLNTNNAQLLKKVRPDSVTMVVEKVHNNIKVLDYNGEEVSKKFGTSFKVDRDVANVNKVIVDCGNCYEDYYKAYIRNKTAWLGLLSESVYLDIASPFKANLEILDSVEIKTMDRGSKFKGKWLVSEVGFTLYPTVKELKGYAKVDKIPENYYRQQRVVK
jgi:hypothetical protein